MARVNLVDPGTASGEAGALLKSIDQAFGVTPNMFRAVANSPAALKSMWGSFGALGQGRIDAKLGEQIAVAIATSSPNLGTRSSRATWAMVMALVICSGVIVEELVPNRTLSSWARTSATPAAASTTSGAP